MIVNYTENGWQIIAQRSHGLLAGQLCGNWKNSEQPENWIETLIAVAEHDDIYNEFEESDLLNEQGGPVNYTMTSFSKIDCERLMGMALTKSTYIAILTSRHIQFVHGKEPAAKSYCKKLQQKEKEWMELAGVTAAQIDRTYELLEFCDAFSLLICQALIQPEQRSMEISKGPDGTSYYVHSPAENQLVVTPWPFQEQSFTVSYESRTLSQLTFKNIKELRKALNDTPATRHQLKISSGPI
jgi:hypothetical protein